MLASINLFPVLPLSGLYFEQFKQRQETARLTTWADGRLHRKNIKYCRNHFKYISVPLFQIAVTQAHLVSQAKICFSQKGNCGYGSPGLNDNCHPVLLSGVAGWMLVLRWRNGDEGCL